MAARVAVALVAVVVLGWLGVMERNLRRQTTGIELARELRVPGNAARAEDAFRDAKLLNPDTTPDINRAYLLRARGDADQATALLLDVLRGEPDNLAAWAVLYGFTRSSDRTTAERALAARRRLDPLNARRR